MIHKQRTVKLRRKLIILQQHEIIKIIKSIAHIKPKQKNTIPKNTHHRNLLALLMNDKIDSLENKIFKTYIETLKKFKNFFMLINKKELKWEVRNKF